MPLARIGAWLSSSRDRAEHVQASPPGERPPPFTPESLHALRSSPRVTSRRAELELGHRARPIDATVRDLYAWFDENGFW
jgi:hypothetical protein